MTITRLLLLSINKIFSLSSAQTIEYDWTMLGIISSSGAVKIEEMMKS